MPGGRRPNPGGGEARVTTRAGVVARHTGADVPRSVAGRGIRGVLVAQRLRMPGARSVDSTVRGAHVSAVVQSFSETIAMG